MLLSQIKGKFIWLNRWSVWVNYKNILYFLLHQNNTCNLQWQWGTVWAAVQIRENVALPADFKIKMNLPRSRPGDVLLCYQGDIAG